MENGRSRNRFRRMTADQRFEMARKVWDTLLTIYTSGHYMILADLAV